jgi:hypothetical protein
MSVRSDMISRQQWRIEVVDTYGALKSTKDDTNTGKMIGWGGYPCVPSDWSDAAIGQSDWKEKKISSFLFPSLGWLYSR